MTQTSRDWLHEWRHEAREHASDTAAEIAKTAETPIGDLPKEGFGIIGNFGKVSRSPEADLEERIALFQDGSTAPNDWVVGFAQLDAAAPPAGFTDDRWLGVLNAGGKFLDEWAGQAGKLGWTACDVFGCHPAAPGARISHHGLVLLIGDGAIVGITTDSATIRRRSGAILTYRREPQPDAITLWELEAGAE